MAAINIKPFQTTSALSAMTVVPTVSPFEITTALEQILSSDLFNRAHRMCRLLRYLIESSLSSNGRQMSEYAIGLDVFDRNPSTYYPGEDPIVRVQMGRLRKRLMSYYAVTHEDSSVIVSIPLGHYEPVIERRSHPSDSKVNAQQCQLSVFPLHYISDDFFGRSLTKDINEQLSQQFQRVFGAALIPYTASLDAKNLNGECTNRYFLEGSTFLHAQGLRINTRLIDQKSHAIMYTAQFDMGANANANAQTEMAEKICEAVQYFINGS